MAWSSSKPEITYPVGLPQTTSFANCRLNSAASALSPREVTNASISSVSRLRGAPLQTLGLISGTCQYSLMRPSLKGAFWAVRVSPQMLASDSPRNLGLHRHRWFGHRAEGRTEFKPPGQVRIGNERPSER